ncbi:MAG: type VI secretion system baseplate subunit TssE [Phycisphaerae bacterium]|nr:type VI secretion system baseplate subunit TssE [Phycisphaerae bacterium]
MTPNRTLLERLRRPDPSDARVTHVGTRVLFDSIVTNLRSILNTVQGNSPIDELYGLPHLTSIRTTMPTSLRQFELAIRRAIEAHEPRLRDVRVRHSPIRPDGLELRFEIAAVVNDDSPHPVRFETVCDDHGRITVR